MRDFPVKKLRIKDGNTKYINLFCEGENGNQSSCGDIVTRTILGGERRRRRENQFSPSEISGTKCWGEEGEGNSTFGRFGCSKKSKFNNVSICCFFKRILHTSLGHLQKCELRDVIDIIFLLGNSFIPMC